MPLEATIERPDRNTAIVTLTNSLTLAAHLTFSDTQLEQLVGDEVTRLVLDMSACPYVDSGGLGALVYTLGLLFQRGGSMRLCNVNQRVSDLLKMTRTDAFLPCDPDRAASLANLASSPLEQ